MNWSEFHVGDVVENDDDLLLVVQVDVTKVHLLALDVVSHYNEATVGGIEVWDRQDKAYERVAKNTRIVVQFDESAARSNER